MPILRIACLASGGGTNVQAIIDSIEAGLLPAKIVAVITNAPGAGVLERAERHGLPHFVVDHRLYHSRELFEDELIRILVDRGAELICLCGFRRILTPRFVGHYPGRIMNIHPALLPAFGGKGCHGEHVHRAVLESGAKYSGCTVHFVDDQADHGPIILQLVVPVMDDDTPETLAQRVLHEEHIAYPQAIGLFVHGRLRIEGLRVSIRQP